MRGGIPRDEQETTMTYDSGEKLVRIYSGRPTDISKLKRAGIKPISGSDNSGFRYIVPMNRFGWRIKGEGKSRRGGFRSRNGQSMSKKNIEMGSSSVVTTEYDEPHHKDVGC